MCFSTSMSVRSVRSHFSAHHHQSEGREQGPRAGLQSEVLHSVGLTAHSPAKQPVKSLSPLPFTLSITLTRVALVRTGSRVRCGFPCGRVSVLRRVARHILSRHLRC